MVHAETKQAPPYLFFADFPAEMGTIPEKGILSRTVYRAFGLKAILFGFAEGEELSEHTSRFSAALYFLEGRASVTVGADRYEVEPGAWIHMEPELPHSIVAHTGVKMLLLMFETVKAD